MFRAQLLTVFFATTASLLPAAIAQTAPPSSNDTIRVTVTVNADGSRTTYQYDNAKHEAIATTADEEGRPLGKVVYRIDDAGRFLSGVVFGPDENFLFKTLYKFDFAGRLEEETNLHTQVPVFNKL